MRTLLALSLLPLAAGDELTDQTFDKWHAFIVPQEKEFQWRRIPWRPVFWDAVVEAQRTEMPVLLWVMNGHPLGCT